MERNIKRRSLYGRPVDKINKTVGNFIFYASLVFISVIMLYPLLFMILAGFFTAGEYNNAVLTLFPIAKNPTFSNYLALFTLGEVAVPFLNSLFRTIYTSAMTAISTVACGYVFSRLRFKGRNIILMGLILTSMVPATVTMIPTFLLYVQWNLYDTWFVYLVGGVSINTMGTFIVKQYLDSIPVSLDESAKIDGAGTARIIFGILLPLAKPIMGYIIITTAIGVWNDWSTAFFYTESSSLELLPSAITRLSMKANEGSALPDYPRMITLGLALTIPALVIYLCFQRYIVEGIAHAGIKG